MFRLHRRSSRNKVWINVHLGETIYPGDDKTHPVS